MKHLFTFCFVLIGLVGWVAPVRAQSGTVTTAQSVTFTYSGQIETFTVPTGVTSLTIEARGAEGGFGGGQFGAGNDGLYAAGKGAVLSGAVSVNSGQMLKILVGQKSPNRNGGGGGSFVTTTANAPLLIAGGGGGSGADTDLPTKDGQAGQTGGNNGGSNGNGGSGRSGAASGGGGLLTDGGKSDNSAFGLGDYPGGKAFVNGGAGATGNDSFGIGGFGGGGIGTGTASGGGGGGYSGGSGAAGGPGGGGGSYNADLNGVNTAGANIGNGLVIIRYQLPPCSPFMVNLGKDGDLTCAKTSVLLTTTGGPAGATYVYNPGAMASSPSSLTASVTSSGPYSVTVTVPGGCSATAGLTVNSNTTAPSVSITPSMTAICQGQTAQLTASGADSFTWSTGQTVNPINVMATGTYSVTGITNSNGCKGTATATVTVNPLPNAPSLVTASGYAYPAGVSSLTISQNTGSVMLLASGCSGQLNLPPGSSGSMLAISTASTGTQTYTATCTNTATGCTSPAGSFRLTVVPTSLQVLSRDPDNGQLSNNTIKPYLTLRNQGNTAISYSEITVRYYLTVEGNKPLLFQKNYAQIGTNNVNLRYVPLNPARQGATGYIEFGFSPTAGSLGAGSTSGPIETQVNKQDYSAFFLGDDYSYMNNGAYTLNPRITAYRNGVIFYGMEPGASGSARPSVVEETTSVLNVTVLGNPVDSREAQVVVSGVAGQAVQLQLVDMQGRRLYQQSIPQANESDQVRVPLESPGLLLLQVSTPTQHQQIKLISR